MFLQKEDLALRSVPSVWFKCDKCGNSMGSSHTKCHDIDKGEGYVWLIEYFRRYRKESIWGEWIQRSLGMSVIYGS